MSSLAREAVVMNPKPMLRKAGITRSRVAALRMRCERYALGYLGERQPPRSRILCYHSVGTPAWGVNDVSPARFRLHLETALKAGYRFVPADLIAAEAGDEPRLAITFDDGLRSVAVNAAPILKELGIPWSLFVVTDWADGNHPFEPEAMLGWDEIEALAADGVTIGSHSVTHPNFARLDEARVEQELYESRLTMASRIGITPASFLPRLMVWMSLPVVGSVMITSTLSAALSSSTPRMDLPSTSWTRSPLTSTPWPIMLAACSASDDW